MKTIMYDNEKAKLEKVEAYTLRGSVRLKLTYICEKEDGVYRVIIPNVDTTIPVDIIPQIALYDYPVTEPPEAASEAYMYTDNVCLPICDGSIPEFDNINHVYFAEKLVSRKVREMTLEEIEEKLGYKVKIVNKGE